MELETLCREIGMPPEVTEIILSPEKKHPPTAGLAVPGRWEETLQSLKTALDPDPKGFQMLACCLRQAVLTWDTYEALGISQEIYFATMACFSRFVREHLVSFGCYGFDRDFWTVRQLSARLFRIGELEYELAERDGEKQIHLHIPSGARLRPEILRASWLEAKALLRRCFPDYASAPMLCDSWLLSPTLKKLLPEGSRILGFQNAFRTRTVGTGSSYLEWVFKRTDLPLSVLPEDTSLQRRLKSYLLAGGVWTEAEGQLEEDPFLTI